MNPKHPATKLLRVVIFAIILPVTLFMPGVSGQVFAQTYPQKNISYSIVAFGDSNTQDFQAGIRNWFEALQGQLPAAHPTYHYTFSNQAVGGKSMSPTTLNNANAQYDINAALSNITFADLGLVMLGTNDAYRGATVTDYVNSYKSFISTVKASGKVTRLIFLSVPPMIFPYNCLTGCFPFPNNPQVDRVVPYNQQIATLPAYCATIRYQCSYINSAAAIPLNPTYIDPGTGIHMLNPAQNVIANAVFNVVTFLPTPKSHGNKKAQ